MVIALQFCQRSQARRVTTKRDILREANYRYFFDRGMYSNRQAKKAFSTEFIDDHPKEELSLRIAEDTGGKNWKFYSNTHISESVKQELERVLG